MEKIKKLKHYFKKENIDGYIVPKNDEFFGENVSDFSDRLNFISNFSGSYGFAIILNDINYLSNFNIIFIIYDYNTSIICNEI